MKSEMSTGRSSFSIKLLLIGILAGAAMCILWLRIKPELVGLVPYVDMEQSVQNISEHWMKCETKHKTLVTTVTEVSVKADKLKAELDSCTSKGNQVAEELNKLKLRTDEVTNNLNQVNEQLRETDDKLNDYKSQKEQLEKQITDKDAKITQLISELQNVNDAMAKQKQEYEAEKQALNQQLLEKQESEKQQQQQKIQNNVQ